MRRYVVGGIGRGCVGFILRDWKCSIDALPGCGAERGHGRREEGGGDVPEARYADARGRGKHELFDCPGGGMHHPFGKGLLGSNGTVRDNEEEEGGTLLCGLDKPSVFQLPISCLANSATDTGGSTVTFVAKRGLQRAVGIIRPGNLSHGADHSYRVRTRIDGTRVCAPAGG
eukprot:CAMPEP_0113566050 /NCGR_PEP_ID=MMETSP0015_2-20120614/22511_1 /TAXON_ID=2838 /ORGANISM="Odontella" /LENGTH=171 /DNA_ID=CAMNT_0000468303 /DNA_START=241 /DNA_END=752 /DNA_ORIENTATION=- /assembly_acc=CAM_ASM_000160